MVGEVPISQKRKSRDHQVRRLGSAAPPIRHRGQRYNARRARRRDTGAVLMTRPTLLESEGWRPVPGKPLRCTCPCCYAELSSNAFARKMHKDKCPSWRTADAAAPTRSPRASDGAAEQPPGVRSARDAAVSAPSDAPRKPAATHLPKLRWTEVKVAGTEEYSAWRDTSFSGGPLTPLRVRRVGMRAAPSFASYAGPRYAGSYPTKEAAMGAAENFNIGELI